MRFSKSWMIALVSLGSVALSALPGMARPGYIYSEANVRSAPSYYSNRIDGLPEGTPLEVLQVTPGNDSRGWYYVRSTGRLRTEGWVASSLVRFEPTNRTYGQLVGEPGDVINIRSDFDRESRVKHTGTTGDLVEVGESRFFPLNPREGRSARAGYTWYSVTYPNGASGWVRGDLISIWPNNR